jgi:hypothetical protein
MLKEGGVDTPTQLESLKVALGAITNWSPTFNETSVKSEGFQTVKQVGYPNHFLFSLVTSPM